MSLTVGARLGQYEVVAPLGKGGMGEVYRARDTKLGRAVAIKVLPEAFASDKERLARFEREAKLLASLNHPNIAGIHGLEEFDGVRALVLELVEGPTLAERIAQGSIPTEEVIAIAQQIALALEAGHEAGVIHRDLKPANIKLKEDGTVKVLDYGLAKAVENDGPSETSSDLSQSPTLTREGTRLGVILGTAAYMSPEQAKGKRVDRRSDIWSFGAVVYEMLTGARAFPGEDLSETLAAVIRAEPDLEALAPDAPDRLRRLVRLCLNKTLSERIQSIGDVRLMLDGAFDPSIASTTTPRAFPFLAVAIAALVTGLGVWLGMRPDAPPVMKLTVSTPPAAALRVSNVSRDVAISPHGDWLVYKGVGGDFHMRHIGSFETTRLDLLDPDGPFVSPDGAWIGFEAVGSLQKIPVQGGEPTTICPVVGDVRGASWGDDGTIVFAMGTGLFRVPSSGGEPEQLTEPDGVSEMRHVFPEILPGSKAALFVIRSDEAGLDWDIGAISLETGERRLLIRGGTSPRYLATGHLAYVLSDALVVVPFDPERVEAIGEPIVTIPDIRPKFSGAANFDVSDGGTLIFQRGYGEGGNKILVWVDRQGREERIPAEARPYRNVTISPEGRRVATSFGDPSGSSNIWIHDFTQGSLSRLTFNASGDNWPAWTRDGERVLFRRFDRGTTGLFWKAADGTGTAEQLLGERFTPFSVSPDGRKVVGYIDSAQTNTDIGEVSLDDRTVRPLIAGAGVQWYPQISPSGRWIAYGSDESGRSEIYVRPYPDVQASQWQITNNRGAYPTWSPTEDEIFYRNYDQMMVVPVSVDEEGVFRHGTPSVLFEGSYDSGGARHYDVSPDGQRFLMMKDEASGEDYDPDEIHVILNWFEDLKRLVPAE